MLDLAFWVLFGCSSLVSFATGGGLPRRTARSIDFGPRRCGPLETWLRDSPSNQGLCLALALFGALTLSKVVRWAPNKVKCDCNRTDGKARRTKGAAPCALNTACCVLDAIGAGTKAVINTMECGTIKGLTSFFEMVDQYLEWLGVNCQVRAGESPTGIKMLRKLEAQNAVLVKHVRELRRELTAQQDKCAELLRHNASLRGRVLSTTEQERIIEQDRVQINSLLDDKARLQLENAMFQREISTMQELLQYAEERHLAETVGRDDLSGDSDDDLFSDDSLLEQERRVWLAAGERCPSGKERSEPAVVLSD